MTNNDLKQISQIFDQKLKPIQQELQQHGLLLKEHSVLLKGHGLLLKEHSVLLKGHGKLLKSLKKDQDTMLVMLDKEQMDQRKRLKLIEEHLSLNPSS